MNILLLILHRKKNLIASREKQISSEEGFAIVVALSLMAFIVLLLLALTSFTIVETESSQIFNSKNKAKSNALLGLQIAIGKLQEHSGQDQAVTTTANILPSETSPVAEGKRYWTGVWNTSELAFSKADSSFAQGFKPNQPSGDEKAQSFKEWLVSWSNEDGSVKMPANINLATVGITEDPHAVELVARGTLGDQAYPTQRVEVRRIKIDDPASSHENHYAFWVGDEGVKAKLNIVDPYAYETTVSKVNSFKTSNRAAGEHFKYLETDYTPNDINLKKVISLDNFANLGINQANLGSSFHSATTHSLGLLTNTRDGGLRHDLTRFFEDGIGIDGKDKVANYPTAIHSHWESSPTWEYLKSFSDISNLSRPVPVRLRTNKHTPIGPILSYISIKLYPSAYRAANGDVVFRAYMEPHVVLWNPFSEAISCPEMVIDIMFDSNNVIGFRYHTAGGNGAPYNRTYGVNSQLQEFPELTHDLNSGHTGKLRGFQFRIDSVEINPGETRFFSLDPDLDFQPYNPETCILKNADNQSMVYFDCPIGIPHNLFDSDSDGVSDGQFRFWWVRESNWSSVGYPSMELCGLRPATAPFGEEDSYFVLRTRSAFGSYQNAEPTQSLQLNIPGFDSDLRMSYLMVLAPNDTPWLNLAQAVPGGINLSGRLDTRSANRAFTGEMYWDGWRPNVIGGVLVENFPNGWDTSSDGKGNGDVVPNLRAGSAELSPILLELPSSGNTLFSPADLQYVPIAETTGSMPNPIGNSAIEHRLTGGEDLHRSVAAYESAPLSIFPNVVDHSYLLNYALWDDYFFSSIPGSLSESDLSDKSFHFANSRVLFNAEASISELLNPDLAAYRLSVNGAFNANSTSVEAWASHLGALNELFWDPINGEESSTPLTNPVSRFSKPMGDSDDFWRGFRQLSKNQINNFAQNIVNEIKLRGPFTSIAEFVNRSIAPDNDQYSRGASGVIESAIISSDLNSEFSPYQNATQNHEGSIVDELMESVQPDLWQYSRNRGYAGWITQADVLRIIGSQLTVRSDTFRIRSYGDVVDPITGDAIARAWCEAIVQRIPEPVKRASEDPDSPDYYEPADSFGRRYEIVKIRWLDQNEI